MFARRRLPLLAGLPSNVSGYARAIAKLRDTYAPNVILGYHISVWGTGVDIGLSNPPDGQVDTLGSRAAAFYNSLGSNFDIAFAEFSDRDSGFYQYVYGDGGQRWFDAGDFSRHARFLSRFSTVAGKRIVVWQIPLGNTVMRAQNNTTGHYQDNRPEWLLNEPAHAPNSLPRCGRRRLPVWRWRRWGELRLRRAGRRCNKPSAHQREHAGVGTGSRRHDANASRPRIDANPRHPYAADDDGGFFRWTARQYYQDSPMSILPGTGQAPSAPAHVRVVP